jgi:CHRD domain
MKALVAGWFCAAGALLPLGCDSPGSSNPTTTYMVTLSADQENPRCPNAGPSAAGTATVVVSDTQVIVNNLTWTGLSGEATAAHVHLGDVGVAGSIVLTFPLHPVSGISKTFTAADYPNPPMADQPADFKGLLPVIARGGTYLNVHTTLCSGGEIRGQITK